MRAFALVGLVLATAACSDSHSPTGTKPPPATSFDTLLANGSIPATGGTLTIHKSGDPLDGLTLTVSPNAFAGAVTITIGSSPNTSLPTANGMVPISPVIHVVSNIGGYANGAITLKIPATVPANTVPAAILYDSATKALEPLTTITYDGGSVTAATSHLDNANILNARLVGAASTRGGFQGRVMAAAASDTGGSATLAVYAIPTALLNQDWDTGFRPGVNDWDMVNHRTEASIHPGSGYVATELWYFNTRASATPLNGRFPIVRNASLSNKTGYRWSSVIGNQVDVQISALTQSIYDDLAMNPQVKDSLQFNAIRASFALAGLNGGTPLPVLVDLRDVNSILYVVAYKAVGNQIFIADPGSPGDASRTLQLGSGGTMVPYTNARAYAAGVSFIAPVTMSLGIAVPLATVASTYPQAVDGTIGNDVFPAAGFYTWSGALFDTMYVVDSLRIWAQCAQCQFGFATTLSPTPSANVAVSYKNFQLNSGLAVDSSSRLGPNGMSSNDVAAGTQVTYGLALASADVASADASTTASFRWLDWRQFTITKLQGTVARSTSGGLVNEPDTLQVSFKPTLLPADVAYQWTFGDSTPTVTVQNNASVVHTFAKSGTFATTVKVVDNRNTQVIARADTTFNSANVELWRITSLTWLGTTANGAPADSAVPFLVLDIKSGTDPTLIALNGPPFPGGDYDEAGFGFASPDSAKHWAQATPIPLAISGPHPPIDIFAYSNTGTATTGTITGQALEAHTGVVTNGGFTVSLVKNGSILSGYIKAQGTTTTKGVTTMAVVIDSVVAVRVQ